LKVILGISCYYHDSAACLLVNGEIKAAAQEERFSRIKNTSVFPEEAIRFCLDYTHICFEQVDLVVFYEKPFLKYERIMDSHLRNIPFGLSSFLYSIPKWTKRGLFLKDILKKEFKKRFSVKIDANKIIFSQHHLSHAAGAFFQSPFDDALIVVVDAVGEESTTSIHIGEKGQIRTLFEHKFPNSLGLFYSAFTQFLGFKVNSGEYKMMGLSSFGNRRSNSVQKLTALIEKNIIRIISNDQLELNMDYFSFEKGLSTISKRKWVKLFGIQPREANTSIGQVHIDIACAAQIVLEKALLGIIQMARSLSDKKFLCFSGGVALNCVANALLLNSGTFDDIFIQPAAGDAGGAIGASFVGHYIWSEEDFKKTVSGNPMDQVFLGPSYSSDQIIDACKKQGVKPTKYDLVDLQEEIARLILSDKLIGLFKGRMEFGPRALGNRSLLASAFSIEIKQKLNATIKERESFRPFAPLILLEDQPLIFDVHKECYYMQFVSQIRKEHQKTEKLKETDNQLIEFDNSIFPGISHFDFSSRIQTVTKETDTFLYGVLQRIKEKTGYGIAINTSFNGNDEPIVCTPNDALNFFFKSNLDFLVMEDYLITKNGVD
tara:strand:+ start:359 stop:2167 length:1809 start_codon:yes stop_codon:yes gene_type:complete